MLGTIVLVTDGSPDATRNTIRSLQEQAPVPLRVFGFSAASGSACRPRNLGIVQARGEYVFFSDSDVYSQPWRLQRSLEAARAGDYDVIAGRARYLHDGTRSIDGLSRDGGTTFPVSEAPDVTLGILRLGNPIVLSTARCVAAPAHGGFTLGCLPGGPGCGCAWRAEFRMLDDVLVDYLIHAGNNELAFAEEDDHWHARL
jgi:glycosyltransferase involved in cell wall biosynthesis